MRHGTPLPRDFMLPRTGITLDEARLQLSGLHFSKEMLSQGERGLLYIAEGLLRLVDGELGDELDDEAAG